MSLHGPDHAELIALYALNALPSGDAFLVEERLSTCHNCRDELKTFLTTVDELGTWPAAVVTPSASLLWGRVYRRASEAGLQPLPALQQPAEPEWKEVAPGIACQLLATDPFRNRVTMLVQLAPGTDYPPHQHDGVEELYMLDGELIVDDQTFYPGDYRRAEPGSVDRRVWSATGCTCVLITSVHDAIL